MTENDIVFRVDDTSDLPIWAQLRNRIAYLIRTGVFAAGEQLPSVRSMAADAKINYNTVSKAYRDLELSGFIVSIRGRGMFVQKDVATEASNSDIDAIDALFEDCVAQYRTQGMTYEEIKNHIASTVDALKQQAREADEERQSYGIN